MALTKKKVYNCDISFVHCTLLLAMILHSMHLLALLAVGGGGSNIDSEVLSRSFGADNFHIEGDSFSLTCPLKFRSTETLISG